MLREIHVGFTGFAVDGKVFPAPLTLPASGVYQSRRVTGA